MMKAGIVLLAMIVIAYGFWVYAKSEAKKLEKEFGGNDDEGYEDDPNSFKHGQAY